MGDSYLIFTIGDRCLAVPAETAIKVTGAPAGMCRSLQEAGLIPAGQRTVRWLNLRQRMQSHATITGQQYLIVVRDKSNNLGGILADSLPDLRAIDPEELKELPTDGDGVMSPVASHALFEPNGNTYVLDLGKLLG